MLLSLSQHVVEIQTWQDKQGMLRNIAQCDGEALILGADAAQEDSCYSVVIHYYHSCGEPDNTRPRNWGIGLISEGYGLKPHLLILPSDLLVLGLNFEAVGVDVLKRQEIFRLSFDTPFRGFIYLEERELLLVLNEIGVVAVSKQGQERWRYEKDVITDCFVDNGKLRMKFMDALPVTVNISTGERESSIK